MKVPIDGDCYKNRALEFSVRLPKCLLKYNTNHYSPSSLALIDLIPSKNHVTEQNSLGSILGPFSCTFTRKMKQILGKFVF